NNIGDLVADVVQGAHCGLATRAGAFHFDIQVLEAVILGRFARTLCRHLGCEGRALARTAEARATGGRPAQGVTLAVSDGDNGVVEGGMNMRDSINDRLLHLLARCLLARLCHYDAFLKTDCLKRSGSKAPGASACLFL